MIHLSFDKVDYQGIGLDSAISHRLKKIAIQYDLELLESSFKMQFEELLQKARLQEIELKAMLNDDIELEAIKENFNLSIIFNCRCSYFLSSVCLSFI